MKPIFLEMQAFGPFVEKQTVDFEKLSKGGIFLISGKTGSGKTTIFDAMTVALYGGGSGEDDKVSTGRNDFTQWRCRQAAADLPTVVSFTFEVKGKRYKFTRRLVQKRVNLSPEYEAGAYDENGELIPFFNNPKEKELNSKAVEIIGLSKEQFRQVVLLPQGQFERFLTAGSSDKEKILGKVFNTGEWFKYADRVFANAKARKDSLDADKKYIDQSLEEDGLSGVAALEERIGELEAKKQENISLHAAFNGKEKQAELTADNRLFQQFKPLHELEKKAAGLEAEAGEIAGRRLVYNNAEKAEQLRSFIDAYENSVKERTVRGNALETLQGRIPDAEKATALATEKKKQHDSASPVAELQKKIGEYEAKQPVYDSYSGLQQSAAAAAKQYRAAAAELETANNVLDKATQDGALCLKKRNEAEALAADYRSRYFAGIYGELASELQEGAKCPVCGSLSHPEPAVKAPDSVSKEQWDAKEKETETAKKHWEKAEETRVKAEREKNEKASATDEKRAAMVQAETALNSARQSLIEGIPDAGALQRAIKGCRDEISAYEKQGEALEKARADADRALQDLKTKTAAAQEEKEKSSRAEAEAESALSAQLQQNGYADYTEVKALLVSSEERKAMHELIVRYDTSVKETAEQLAAKREELAGKTEPDSSAFEQRQKEITEENESFNTLDAKLGTEITRYKKKLENLSKAEERYSGQIKQAESDLAFAKKLRGDSGVGLERYILAVMFSKVIDEANRMLRNVHNGRYTLFRSDEKGNGNKRGLELKVHDSRSPGDEAGRQVSMLSGGEKFLVSLALSIGLSTVAQKSGVQIEALFIDEGFGTLDTDSIGDAMTVLDSVRRGSSTIGIISHVELLESVISSKLEVEKTDGINRIKPV